MSDSENTKDVIDHELCAVNDGCEDNKIREIVVGVAPDWTWVDNHFDIEYTTNNGHEIHMKSGVEVGIQVIMPDELFGDITYAYYFHERNRYIILSMIKSRYLKGTFSDEKSEEYENVIGVLE